MDIQSLILSESSPENIYPVNNSRGFAEVKHAGCLKVTFEKKIRWNQAEKKVLEKIHKGPFAG